MNCIAPSEILETSVASEFGRVAELIIGADYLRAVGRSVIFPMPGSKEFLDVTAGFASKTVYPAFLKTHNPNLKLSEFLTLDRGLVRIPDILTHDPGVRLEAYEIKPNSKSGISAGLEKVAFLDAAFNHFSLPYRPGRQYKPNKRIKIFAGVPLGCRLQLHFHFFHLSPGLIVYEICAEGDLAELGLKILKAIIAGVVIALVAALLAMQPELAPVVIPAL